MIASLSNGRSIAADRKAMIGCGNGAPLSFESRSFLHILSLNSCPRMTFALSRLLRRSQTDTAWMDRHDHRLSLVVC